ncbi:MAG: zf-HC2 domain-containing protein [Gemmatimonadota bacterium]
MTDDVTHLQTSSGPGPTPHCAAFDASLPGYLAGRLNEADAIELETHAAECERCEAILETATRRDVTAFAPPLPAELRSATLAAVGSGADAPLVRSISASRGARRWRIGGSVAALAAAAALALMVSRRDTTDTYGPEGVVPRTLDTASAAFGGNPVQQGAARLASEGARAEFESLDAAAHEIEQALQAAPDDPELRSYLSSVRARRDELAQRVKQATS